MTTWNPADLSNITLSGGNLIATPSSAAVAGVRGTTFKSAGKLQLQFTNVNFSATFDMIGMGDVAMALTGETSNGNEFMISNSGSIYCNNNGFGAPAVAANCTIDMCVDIPNKLGWFRVNGSSWNAGGGANPATGAGGYTFTGTSFAPFVELTGTGAHATLNPSPSGLISGFSAWDTLPPFPYAQARVIG